MPAAASYRRCARGRGFQPAGLAHEQGLAQQRLQLAQVAADAGLGAAQPGGGRGQRAGLQHRDERAQQVPVGQPRPGRGLDAERLGRRVRVGAAGHGKQFRMAGKRRRAWWERRPTDTMAARSIHRFRGCRHVLFDPVFPCHPAPPLHRARRRRRGARSHAAGRLQQRTAGRRRAGLVGTAGARRRPAPLDAGACAAGTQPAQPPALACRPAPRRRDHAGVRRRAPAARDRPLRPPGADRLRRLPGAGGDRRRRTRRARGPAALPRRRAGPARAARRHRGGAAAARCPTPRCRATRCSRRSAAATRTRVPTTAPARWPRPLGRRCSRRPPRRGC